MKRSRAFRTLGMIVIMGAAPVLGIAQVVPALGIVQDDSVALNLNEKLAYSAANSYGPWELLGSAAYAGILQGIGTPEEWGGGAAGYGKRLASTLAGSGIHGVLAFGLDSALHEDPRYFRSRSTGFWNRTGHAVRGTVLTHTDAGGETFSVWRFGSAYGAAFLSNEWYPDRLNTVRLGLLQGSLRLGFDLAANLGSEFWPDIKTKILRRKP
jgi:hypothetical protein